MSRFSWTSANVCKALQLSATGAEARTYTGISTDTRTIRPGELFVALRGERFDGTDFVAAAVEAGAAGAVVERRPAEAPDGFELFVVEDALSSLGRLAAARRAALGPVVVAITGTSGKTTTRELTAAALGSEAYASPGNFNNLVGLPLSILQAAEEAGIWVLEVASNQPGEIQRLGRIAAPDIAVITSVSEGHLEGLGDFQGVLEEKLSLLSTLREGGLAFISDRPPELVSQARARLDDVVTVGLGDAADEGAQNWAISETGVRWSWSGVEFELSGFGAHLIQDALFAVVVAARLGVEPKVIAERLQGSRLPPMRGEVRRMGALLLIVDCYNANPASFRSAIESLGAFAAGRRRAVLAGTMLELGERSADLHEEVAHFMVSSGIELIAATGEFGTAFSRVADRPQHGLILKDDLEEAYGELVPRLQGDEAVLLKASRGMKFERAIPWFERDFGNPTVARSSGTDG